MPSSEIPERLVVALADRYRVERELGEGGMATVYLAEDRKHRRRVAIKVLKPELAAAVGPERFLREIEIAAKLHHPHILPLYDSAEVDGVLFYVMPYVEGESLRGRLARERQLPLADALHIAREVADALSYAHSHGVVHRDIKPENILLESGHAVVADFGIARAISEAGGASLTETGLAVGTPIYMSPEQASSAQDLDGRSDLYSLGCVLFEMLAGQPPFTGPTADSIIHQHLTVQAPPVTNLRPAVPRPIVGILHRALAKLPADRFNPAAQFAEALAFQPERVSEQTRRPEQAGRSIAVLPFVNMSPNPENEYFSDGITEELIGALSRVHGLQVAARTSSFAFKGKDVDVREIGEALNAELLLEGSVRQAGKRVRIAAQLVKAADGYHLWSETFDRTMDDVFALQDDVARAIVSALELTLGEDEEEGLVRPPTADVEAYHLYLKARFHWNKRHEDALHKGIEFFEAALERDPGFALAYVGLADSYNILGFYCAVPPREAFPRARSSVERALELAGDLAEAHASRAYVALYHDWDWEAADRGFRRAIELNPQYSVAYQWYGNHLAAMGRFSEGIAHMEHARQLDPFSLIINAGVGWLHHFARDFPAARRELERALEMDDRFVPALIWSGTVADCAGDLDRAGEFFTRAVEASGGSTDARAGLARVLGLAGETARARELLAELEAGSRYVSPFDLALVHTGLGDREAALAALEAAYADRSHWLVLSNVEPRLDALRDDDRFNALIAKLGFPSAERG